MSHWQHVSMKYAYIAGYIYLDIDSVTINGTL